MPVNQLPATRPKVVFRCGFLVPRAGRALGPQLPHALRSCNPHGARIGTHRGALAVRAQPRFEWLGGLTQVAYPLGLCARRVLPRGDRGAACLKRRAGCKDLIRLAVMIHMAVATASPAPAITVTGSVRDTEGLEFLQQRVDLSAVGGRTRAGQPQLLEGIRLVIRVLCAK